MNQHTRAFKFMAQRIVEGLSPEQERALELHLAECESCSAEQRRLTESLSALRAVHLDLPPNLASRTQFRVRLRAEELREHGPANRLIWSVAVVSWIFGLATAPFVWHGFEWLGQHAGVPKIALQLGFVLWWGLPALLAAGIVLWQRERGVRGTE
jgi:hypothetical protein